MLNYFIVGLLILFPAYWFPPSPFAVCRRRRRIPRDRGIGMETCISCIFVLPQSIFLESTPTNKSQPPLSYIVTYYGSQLHLVTVQFLHHFSAALSGMSPSYANRPAYWREINGFLFHQNSFSSSEGLPRSLSLCLTFVAWGMPLHLGLLLLLNFDCGDQLSDDMVQQEEEQD